MGVPKFFRWISERYPNLSVNIENNQVPVFDCLYLDMNGIIHVCSHPDDTNVQFRITEEEIFLNIFKYIDFLFKTVKPKEVFFLAIDGVAPRAKMNQQRGRRFKSTKEANDRDEAAMQNGVILPAEKRFDSNAITPGTVFMDRLQRGLWSFISEKVSSDSLWYGVDVILSGHETPGEGEHKIQEYIRYRRSLPNYNPNTRHCLYGLDADLLLLSLATHEPYFSLLREEVIFSTKSKARRAYIAEETKFFLLHISLLRTYIDYEFHPLRLSLGDKYDLERIIDDWIVLSFLVGNDFVPHLPNIHIHTSALPLLWDTYIKVRPQMPDYINNHGKLDMTNLLTYITDLAHFDQKHFEDLFEDMKWMFGKTGEKMAKELDNLDKKAINNNSLNILEEEDLIDFGEDRKENKSEERGPELIEFDNYEKYKEDEKEDEKDDGNDDGDDIWRTQFEAHKKQYYYNKLELTWSPEMLVNQAKEYFTALQWISYYYFSGVPSWSWFYPQHYAPFVSDLLFLSDDIKKDGISFEMGRPFLPFEQLMAVLPSDSSELLPNCYSILMTMRTSPIIDFYPKTFKLDLNGKKQEWEALVLIPFIEEKRLLCSLEGHKELLTSDEKRRNVHSAHMKFRFSQRQLLVSEIDPAVFQIPRESMLFGLCPNVQLDVIYQGFPTFKYIAHSFVLERAFVKIFENHSTLESIVLKITPAFSAPTLETVAQSFLHKLAYVNWPAFMLTKVVAVLDKENRLSLDPTSKAIVKTPLSEKDTRQLTDFIASQTEELYKQRAIVIDKTNTIVLETLHSEGNVYEIVSRHKAGCSVRLERNWVDNKVHWHFHQMSMLHESIDVVKGDELNACTKLSQLFPIDSLVFCLDSKHYGQIGKILSINNIKGSIMVKLDPLKEPEYSEINVNDTGVEYITVAQASEYLSIDPMPLSKITGSIFINMFKSNETKNRQKLTWKDRHSIGLDLKNNKLNLQIPGWVIKTGGENGTAKWLYSMKVVKILDDYRNKFPQVFEFIKRPNFESLTLEDLFDVNGDEKLLQMRHYELRAYLESLEYRTVERLSNDHVLLTESQISAIEKIMANIEENASSVKTEIPIEVELEFKELYRPHCSLQGTRPDMTTEYRLLDRVVCCTDSYTVPLSLRGVVIGLEPLTNSQTRLEILFDKEFSGAISIRGSGARCYRMPAYTLINTSHGIRKFNSASTLDKKIPIQVMNHAPLLPSICRNKSLYQQHNIVTNVLAPTVNQSLSSDLLSALFSTPSSDLPPMPSQKYSENITVNKSNNVVKPEHHNDTLSNDATKNGILHIKPNPVNLFVHCDQLFKGTATPPSAPSASSTHTFTTVINSANCPEPYTSLFRMCNQCGVVNPTIRERHINNDIFMSFACGHLDLPETKETDLTQGRVNHVARIWQCLYALQQPRPYHPPSYTHLFVPPQFQENPFTAMYPSQHLRSPTAVIDPCITTESLDSNQAEPPSALCHHNGRKLISLCPTRPFIRAPKSTLNFPKA